MHSVYYQPTMDKAKEVCARVLFESCNFSQIQCVYGMAGKYLVAYFCPHCYNYSIIFREWEDTLCKETAIYLF